MKNKIKIINNTVYITIKSKHFRQKHESPYLTNILNTQGFKALQLYLLKTYEQGNSISATPNKYSKAINKLKKTPNL